MLRWIDTVLQGLMLGGLYALFAMGLALMFGVMRLVNTAHGDLVILAAFLGFLLTDSLGIGPLGATAVVVPCAFLFGYVLQRGVLNFVVTRDPLPSLVVTFGMATVVQNLLLEAFSADSRSIAAGGLETASIPLAGGLTVGVLPMFTLLTAFCATLGLQWVTGHTALGRAFRATSDDREAALLMGIGDRHIYALATGIAVAIVGVAGMLHGMRTTIAPSDGPVQLIYAFEVVIIGGMGSFWGSFVGGMILGVAQSIGFRLDPGWGILAGHLVFVLALIVRPSGLFPKTR